MRGALTCSLVTLLLAGLLLPAASDAAPAPGERAWVRDTLYVPLRRGPTGQHGIIRTLVSGTEVTVQSTPDGDADNTFVEVRTSNGTSGWLPAQYLVDQPIAQDQLAAATTTIADLQADLRAATAAQAALADRRAALQAELDALQARYGDLEQAHAELTALSADAVETNRQAQALGRLNAVLESEVDRLAVALHAAEDANGQWLLVSGGLLLGGGLLGGVLLGGRRRSSWA